MPQTDYPNPSVVVSGDCDSIEVTPTISTGAYSANDNIGGKHKIPSAMIKKNGTAYLMNLAIRDKAAEAAVFEGYIFNSEPTAGTYTDNDAMVIGADLSKCIGLILVAAGDYKTVGAVSFAEIDIRRLYKAAGGQDLWIAWRVTGAPDYDSTTDLTFIYKFDRNVW